ncbi:alpha/beta hydrolase [Microbacterium sp. LWH13-1.2]|uniref:alpha/beta fold hydrolase n=1 Tax=Microbacterium sp. LWH13-1.2 TaxID=3135260 RepID=UPI0031393653
MNASASTIPPLRRGEVDVNGQSFHVLDQGEGPAVLFAHGFPDVAETWLTQMAGVAAAGYRAVALDMRGFGASYSPSDVELYSALHTVGDLVGLLEALEITEAVLVGHDWGADVAQRAMVLRPDLFLGLVSVSIPFLPRGEVSTWDQLRNDGLADRYYAFEMMKPEGHLAFEPAAASIPSALYWLSGSPATGEGWDPIDASRGMLRPAPVSVPSWADPSYVSSSIAAFQKSGFDSGLNYYRASDITFEQLSAFKGVPIRQPALYIWGAEDGLCQLFHPEPPTVEQLRASAPRLVDVIRLEGVGHWPQHEAAERVTAEIVTFLAGIDWPDTLHDRTEGKSR